MYTSHTFAAWLPFPHPATHGVQHSSKPCATPNALALLAFRVPLSAPPARTPGKTHSARILPLGGILRLPLAVVEAEDVVVDPPEWASSCAQPRA